jgi:NAD(P)-dependent dehydrogenase (short-subunit alcohol dehydrogenase family)/acyl carrier protein
VLNLLPLATDDTTRTLTLIQALNDTAVPVPMWTITAGATSPAADDPAPDPHQAAVWGLGRVAALEHPQQWGGLLDLPADPRPEHWSDLVQLLAHPGEEDQLAIRQGVHVRRLDRAPSPGTPGARWRPLRTTLVTGGTGALGPHIARWLADAGAEHLVVTSRRGEAAEGMPELVAELAERGVRVTVAACDVADREAVAALVARLDSEGCQVSTVIHAAALMQLNSLPALTVEEFQDVVEAKVAGARHLDELLAHHPVEAFVLFSSIAGVWGSGDHGAYAAANAYLDAFAEQRRARGLPATSVAWGVWGSDKLPDAVDPDFLKRQGLPLIDPGTAFAGLQQALDHDETFIALADVDWARFVPVFTSARRRPLLDTIPEVAQILAAADEPQPAQDAAGSSLAQRLEGLSDAEQEEELLGLVTRNLAVVLGHAADQTVAADRSFKQLGIDSLTAVELRNRLNTATGLRLPATLVYDHPNPGAVVRLLRGELVADAPLGSVADELDRLEAAFAEQSVAPTERTVVAARLRTLLTALDGGGQQSVAAADDDPEDDLDLVSDEEMFDLIDRELGEG